MIHIKKTFMPFGNPNFRFFVLASIISGAGNALIPIAFAIESVKIEPSGWGITLVLIFLWAGRFIGMLGYKKYGSAKKPVKTMIVSDSFRLLAQLGLFLWILFIGKNLYAMAFSAVLYGLASSFYNPASFVVIPQIIAEEIRHEANSLISIFGDIYSVLGPLIGASAVIWLGFETVLIFDVITFLLSLVLLIFIRKSEKDYQTEQPGAEPAQKFIGTQHSPFPGWTVWGLLSWFFILLIVGFMGTAGPTLIITSYSGNSWALVATSIALGSLVGSAASLLGRLKNWSWPYLQLLCAFGSSIQIILLVEGVFPLAIALFGFIVSTFAAVSSIRWDTICQASFTEGKLHSFSSWDQMVITTAIPLGMVLFGASSLVGGTTLTVYLLSILASCSTIPLLLYRKNCPKG